MRCVGYQQVVSNNEQCRICFVKSLSQMAINCATMHMYLHLIALWRCCTSKKYDFETCWHCWEDRQRRLIYQLQTCLCTSLCYQDKCHGCEEPSADCDLHKTMAQHVHGVMITHLYTNPKPGALNTEHYNNILSRLRLNRKLDRVLPPISMITKCMVSPAFKYQTGAAVWLFCLKLHSKMLIHKSMFL